MLGMTPLGMAPRLWEATGLSYEVLMERLVNLARNGMVGAEVT